MFADKPIPERESGIDCPVRSAGAISVNALDCLYQRSKIQKAAAAVSDMALRDGGFIFCGHDAISSRLISGAPYETGNDGITSKEQLLYIFIVLLFSHMRTCAAPSAAH